MCGSSVVEEANLKFVVSRVDDVDHGSNCKFELRESDFVGSSGKLEIAHGRQVGGAAAELGHRAETADYTSWSVLSESVFVCIHGQFCCCSKTRCLGEGIKFYVYL